MNLKKVGELIILFLNPLFLFSFLIGLSVYITYAIEECNND